MASSLDFVEFACGQIRETGMIRYRKMFGDYMVYVNEKPALLICDNIVYIKELPCIAELMSEAEKGFPYEGSKEHYILDIDHKSFCCEVIRKIEPMLEFPKPKKKKSIKV